MPLPSSRELREMLDEATPAPWQFLDSGYITASTTLAVIDIYSRWVDDERNRNEDFHLAALAPQLAEEVIRLREEIDRIKWRCLDSVQVAEAEARLADSERGKARQEGRAEAYYDTYLQITQEPHKENQ